MELNEIYLIGAGIAGLVLGLLIAQSMLRKKTAKKIEEAKSAADKIIYQAKQKGDQIKKDRIYQAKEKFLELKAEHEKKTRERDQKTQEAQKRIR
ncbi:MAG: Rnase Y domain-containing protein, partial [Flavobacteriaceae bacterium]